MSDFDRKLQTNLQRVQREKFRAAAEKNISKMRSNKNPAQLNKFLKGLAVTVKILGQITAVGLAAGAMYTMGDAALYALEAGMLNVELAEWANNQASAKTLVAMGLAGGSGAIALAANYFEDVVRAIAGADQVEVGNSNKSQAVANVHKSQAISLALPAGGLTSHEKTSFIDSFKKSMPGVSRVVSPSA